MKWLKKGLVYKPNGSMPWNKLYGILPTPFLLNDKTLRIFFASTDEERIGRISFLDVNAANPSEILAPSGNPVVEPGIPGSFDDCGCNPSCVLKVRGSIFLYYAGYQRSYKTPYSIFTGLAISNEDGTSFQKFKAVPLLDRTDEELSIRSAPTIIQHEDQYLMWYVSATGWKLMTSGIFKDRLMPRYTIRMATSTDALHWRNVTAPTIQYENENEFGFGRPWVIRDGNTFKMWYSVRRTDVSYRIGYAESADTVNWIRKDQEVGIDISKDGWDSEMICYPAVIKYGTRTYMFYNGNNNGETGFGWAELME